MQFRLRSWQFAAVIVVLGLAVSAGIYWYRKGGPAAPADLASYLPTADATVVYIDVDAMRRSGILNMIAGSKAAEDLEYKEFVQQTDFDYRHDLDAVAAAFKGDQVFFLLRGHFNWNKLRAYAAKQGGTCRSGFCSVDGSKPGRRISFYSLRSNLMAMAVSADDMAAYRIVKNAGNVTLAAPPDPVWILVPAAVLKNAEALPAGTRAFASALENAERIVFAIGPQDDHLLLSLNVTCATPEVASSLLVQLEGTTNTLRKWLAREKQQPNPGDLSGVLSSGSFRREDRHVLGQWPLQRAFVDSLTGGAH